MSSPGFTERSEPLPTHGSSNEQPENPYFCLVPGQKILTVPSFTLDSGTVLRNVPVAYKTWGALSLERNNVMVVCHALTGSADVAEWWGPLLAPGKALDTARFFIICVNLLGSPYGTASPMTAKHGNRVEGLYGAEFPSTTIRDDVRLQRLLLDTLGIRQVAVVIGGSMGGMLALEWALFGKDYVRCIVPIATSSNQGAWALAWGEVQRRSIFNDPKWQDGQYARDDAPVGGLETARMTALLTYRSRNSLEAKFGRGIWTPKGATSKGHSIQAGHEKKGRLPMEEPLPLTPREAAAATSQSPLVDDDDKSRPDKPVGSSFAAHTYLRHQARKFTKRFDANCYVALTEKLDTHDLCRGRSTTNPQTLALIQQPTLVLGVPGDGLYPFPEQEQIAQSIPGARLSEIVSDDGHDAFLIEAGQVNRSVVRFLKECLPDIMEKPGLERAKW